ncbi:dTDP-4-dehydrorhamnose reductase [Micromonospora profundi]|uniref:dTDP-4-dehydrorhamnose reductase family protein n=1 Tax=Micromonospora profundi TaxID=1420889 RepID=UPI00143A52F5|nr:SDR family oxidoreductase [Micromonospora profundi]NJC13549.1 dTDP-4-dehydrorhamnose reductase [Micromonospora profundi]
MTQRVLILGATGMLGHTLLRSLSEAAELDVYGCARSTSVTPALFPGHLRQQITPGVDVTDPGALRRILTELSPDVVVNCVGVIKQRPDVEDAPNTIAVNALFPHVLARECAAQGTRLVQVSTDCVFSGRHGDYREQDIPDPYDLYGRAKLLGETVQAPALTLRTSIIGHELGTARSLVDWFLAQRGTVNGYTEAIYSGVTTVEFAAMLRTVVLPRPDLTGLYHVASAPISKYELLKIVAEVYGWPGRIEPSDQVRCDRSLSADAFRQRTGYLPPEWRDMIVEMHRRAVQWRLPAALGTAQPARY